MSDLETLVCVVWSKNRIKGGISKQQEVSKQNWTQALTKQ